MSAAERRDALTALACMVGALAVAALLGWIAFGGLAPSPAEDLRGLACWLEPNPSQPQGVEEVCGPHELMPAGSVLTVAGDDSPCWAEEGVSCGPAQIEEDDPRWDCRTMGNRLCGPGTPHGSDGRYAPCDLVTEEGVTEHLAAFAERCGD